MNEHTVYHTTVRGMEREWTLLGTHKGICRILFPHDTLDSAVPWVRRHRPGAELVRNESAFTDFGVLELLPRYFRGERVSFDHVPLDLWGTPFQQSVWLELAKIPCGSTRTYREIAELIGRPAAVRAVGAANGANPMPIILPCHRVVGADRKLVGYRGGLSIKSALLELEGVNGLAAAGHERFRF